MNIRISDRGIKGFGGNQRLVTMFVINGKRYYSRVDRAIVDRMGESYRRSEDRKFLVKLKERLAA